MFDWYNKKAAKNTIVGYLSRKYSLRDLNNLTRLELPDTFDNDELYLDELKNVLDDSPWKNSEVKYFATSRSSKISDNVSEMWNNAKGYLFTQTTEEKPGEDFGSGKIEKDLPSPHNPNEKTRVSLEQEENYNSIDLSTNDDENSLDQSFPNHVYEFCIDANNKIFSWKGHLKEEWTEFPFNGYLFTKDNFAGCWVEVEVNSKNFLLDLPSKNDFLFTTFARRKDMLETDPSSRSCWVKNTKPLESCVKCDGFYLTPGIYLCEWCFTDEENEKKAQPISWIEKNRNLLLIAGAIVVLLVIINSQ